MRRENARSEPCDMALLGLIELAFSFTAIHAVIQASGAPAWFPSVFEHLSRSDLQIAGLLTLMLGAIAATIGLYRPHVCRDRTRLLIATLAASFLAFAVLMLAAGGLAREFTSAQAITVAQIIGAWLLTIGLIRMAFLSAITRLWRAPRRILLMGEGDDVGLMQTRLASRRGRGFDPVMLHTQELSFELLREYRVWGVVLSSPVRDGDLAPLLDCKLRGMRVLSGSAFQEDHLHRIDLDQLTGQEFLLARGFASGRAGNVMKRASDLFFSVAMIMATLPLMALTALAIKADSSGPVLYRQSRIGAFGKPFTVFKFRSMTANAEAGGKPTWAQKHDPRVTRVGRLIRAMRIDELPQLVNVIRGEMSLVGPRPERPHFVEQLGKAIPFYHQRSYVKPGLTGWAQVNYPYGASVEDAREKLAYDLYYVKHRSFWLDMRILFATIRVVLFREGAR